MKKVVILGCENSHADSFLDILKNYPEFSDVSVIGVYSEEQSAMDELSTKYGVYKMQALDEFKGKVDGVIITARHGAKHYEFAKPYIKKGVAFYIDKPITITEEEGLEFMSVLKENGIKICGGSICKHDDFVKEIKALRDSGETFLGGFARAPYQPNSVHAGYYFYGQHLVEIICEMFGRFPKSVIATKNEVAKTISVTFKYDNYDALGVYVDNNYEYFGMVHTEKEIKCSKVFTTCYKECSYREFKEYYDLITGKTNGADYKEFISPVFIMNAIFRAIKSGKEEIIKGIKI